MKTVSLTKVTTGENTIGISSSMPNGTTNHVSSQYKHETSDIVHDFEVQLQAYTAVL